MDATEIIISLIQLGKQNNFQVTAPWDGTYSHDMTIWNRRLQTSPGVIAFCEKEADVAVCVKWCRQYTFPFRIRSGGHHHEGLSCDWRVLVIDLSKMNTIQYVSDNEAWIPVGKQLQYVYKELAQRNKIIPGGGCETVCVGGLTLGGGWGMSARKYGLTCDNIIDANVVLADGRLIKNIAAKPDFAELFWALKGGGAGNFGIVTQFLFKLSDASGIKTFSLTWQGEPQVRAVMEQWINTLTSMPENITTACRLYMDEPGSIAFKIFGQVYGSLSNAEAYVNELLNIAVPVSGAYKYTENAKTITVPVAASMPSDAAEASELQHFAVSHHSSLASEKPEDTCLQGPLPHKVSSAFLLNNKVGQLTTACIDFINKHTSYFTNANAYLSLHSFGGAIARVLPNQTAFPYRDRNLLLQFQAWWSDPADPLTQDYINWIRNFRTYLAGKGLLDGGFFNFQDMDIVPNYNGSAADRRKLLTYYYGSENFNRLVNVKRKFDPDNFFNSPMSVPVL